MLKPISVTEYSTATSVGNPAATTSAANEKATTALLKADAPKTERTLQPQNIATQQRLDDLQQMRMTTWMPT